MPVCPWSLWRNLLQLFHLLSLKAYRMDLWKSRVFTSTLGALLVLSRRAFGSGEVTLHINGCLAHREVCLSKMHEGKGWRQSSEGFWVHKNPTSNWRDLWRVWPWLQSVTAELQKSSRPALLAPTPVWADVPSEANPAGYEELDQTTQGEHESNVFLQTLKQGEGKLHRTMLNRISGLPREVWNEHWQAFPGQRLWHHGISNCLLHPLKVTTLKQLQFQHRNSQRHIAKERIFSAQINAVSISSQFLQRHSLHLLPLRWASEMSRVPQKWKCS